MLEYITTDLQTSTPTFNLVVSVFFICSLLVASCFGIIHWSSFSFCQLRIASIMGGKKPLGAQPNRGHLHNRSASRGHASHRMSRPVDPASSSSGGDPLLQEFSLFSQANSKLWNKDISSVAAISTPIPERPTLTPNRVSTPLNLTSDSLDVQVSSLRDEIDNIKIAMEYMDNEFRASLAHISNIMLAWEPYFPGYYNGALPAAQLDTKKLSDRIATLEGRQKSMQSKISHLDQLYGTSTAAWAKSIKQIQQKNEIPSAPSPSETSENASNNDASMT